MKKYGVLGHPVAHSLSPKMFTAAFKAKNIEAMYEFCEVEPSELNCFMKRIKTGEFAGLSVTVPYKETILEYCDVISEDAKKIGAANCLYVKDGMLYAENTDWYGFLESLNEVVGSDLAEKQILILGAGGAARACIYALNSIGVTPFVTNRTMSKVEELASEFDLNMIGDDLLSEMDFDIIVNATSVGLNDDDDDLIIPLECLGKAEFVFDLIYKETKLVQAAEEYNVSIIDARRMLLLQGIKQFKLFTGLDAPVEVMWDSLIN